MSQLELWFRSNAFFHLEMKSESKVPAPEIECGASRQSVPEFLRGFVRCLFISNLS